MTPDEWLELAALMAELWSHAPPEPAVVQAYGQQLHDLPADAVRAALYAARADHAFLPTATAVRELVHGPPRPWEDALAELGRAINQVGAYGAPPAFADPALAQVVADRGWRDLCLAVYTDATWRAQFRDAYTAAQRLHVMTGQRQAAGLARPTAPPLPAGDNRDHSPSSAVANLEERGAEVPPSPTSELSGRLAHDQLAQALSLNSALDEWEAQELQIDNPAIPDTPAVRRRRRALAEDKVDRLRREWATRESEALRDPARLARLERMIEQVRVGRPQPGPLAVLDRPAENRADFMPAGIPADLPPQPPPPETPPLEVA